MNFRKPAYDSSNHTIWTGGALRKLSYIDESVDWDWPRIFVRAYLACCIGATDTYFFQYGKLSEQDKANLISNIVGHLGAVKSDEIKKRQLDIFAKVDPEFASAIAKGMNFDYTPPS